MRGVADGADEVLVEDGDSPRVHGGRLQGVIACCVGAVAQEVFVNGAVHTLAFWVGAAFFAITCVFVPINNLMTWCSWALLEGPAAKA